ncbi:MAG: PQQ-binding-like beta-propeller repeat protein [Halioglobus sp.]
MLNKTLLRPISWLAFISIAAPAGAAAACEGIDSQPDKQRVFSEAWGTRYNGQRFQSAENTSINAETAPGLTLKWAYGLSTDSPRSYPLVTSDTLFIGDGGRGLVALDRETGCVRWENNQVKDISTAIVPATIDGQPALVFSQRYSGVYAASAATGKILWHSHITRNPVPMYSGTPLVFSNKVFVPISSQEIALSFNPFYGCCTTSGAMAALDIQTGELLWYRPTIKQEPRVTGRHFLFVEKQGPSGAPVWGAPMLDTERGLLVFGTGQNYSHPATQTSDAIFAVHIETGEIAWVSQFTANDAYNMACEISPAHPNCPAGLGPDLDFGAPPIKVSLASGKDLYLAGQKSGDIYAIEPETGETVWATKIGAGGKLGGIHWGMAASESLGLLFVPISDVRSENDDPGRNPGLHALRLNDGTIKWSLQRQNQCTEPTCWTGLSSAISAGPGIVVTGGLDGVLEVVGADDGKRLWSFNTNREFTAVNNIPTKGGGIDAHGPMLADNLLIVSSGYGSFFQEGGNALLVFSIAEGVSP